MYLPVLTQIRRKRIQTSSSHHKTSLRNNTDITNNLASDEMLDLPTKQYIYSAQDRSSPPEISIPLHADAKEDIPTKQYIFSAQDRSSPPQKSIPLPLPSPLPLQTDAKEDDNSGLDVGVGVDVDDAVSNHEIVDDSGEEYVAAIDQVIDRKERKEIKDNVEKRSVEQLVRLAHEDRMERVKEFDFQFFKPLRVAQLKTLRARFFKDTSIFILDQELVKNWYRDFKNNSDKVQKKQKKKEIIRYFKNLENGMLLLDGENSLFLYRSEGIIYQYFNQKEARQDFSEQIQNIMKRLFKGVEFRKNYQIAPQNESWFIGYDSFWKYVCWQMVRRINIIPPATIFSVKILKFLIDVGNSSQFVGESVRNQLTQNLVQDYPNIPFTPFPYIFNSCWFHSVMLTLYSTCMNHIGPLPSNGFDNMKKLIQQIIQPPNPYPFDFDDEKISELNRMTILSRTEFQRFLNNNQLNVISDSYEIQTFLENLIGITGTTSGEIICREKIVESKTYREPIVPFFDISSPPFSDTVRKIFPIEVFSQPSLPINVQDQVDEIFKTYMQPMHRNESVLELYQTRSDRNFKGIGPYLYEYFEIVKIQNVKFMTLSFLLGVVAQHDQIVIGDANLSLCGIISVISAQSLTREELFARNYYLNGSPAYHFVSHIRQGNQWYYYDDKTLCLCPCDLDWGFVSKQGYLFFYSTS